MVRAYVFDVDGVLFDVSKRLNLAKQYSSNRDRDFWTYFFSEDLLKYDEPRRIGIEILNDRLNKGLVIIVTGRPEKLRKSTILQLMSVGIPIEKLGGIYMRRDNDFRKSYIYKEEVIRMLTARGIEIVEVHDDDEEFLRRLRDIPNCKLYLHRDSDVVELYPKRLFL